MNLNGQLRDELSSAEFGDRRLTRRLCTLAETMLAAPDKSSRFQRLLMRRLERYTSSATMCVSLASMPSMRWIPSNTRLVSSRRPLASQKAKMSGRPQQAWADLTPGISFTLRRTLNPVPGLALHSTNAWTAMASSLLRGVSREMAGHGEA